MRLEFIKSAILTIICFLGARPAVAEMLANNEDGMKRVDGARLMEKIGFKLTPCGKSSDRRWARIRCTTIIVDGETYIVIASEKKPYVYYLRKPKSSVLVGTLHARMFSSTEEAALKEFSSYRFDSSMFPDPIPSRVILEPCADGAIWISLKGAAWCDLLNGKSLIGFSSFNSDIGFCKKIICAFIKKLEDDTDKTKCCYDDSVEQILPYLQSDDVGKANVECLLDVLKQDAVTCQEELWCRKESIARQWEMFRLWVRLTHKYEGRYGVKYIIEDIEAENIYIRLSEWKKLGRYTDADIEEVRKILEPELGVKIELKE